MQIKNIKFNWKTAFIIGLLITLISGCKVQAVISDEFISVDSTFRVVDRGIDFYNQLFRDFYNDSSIDISTFSGYYNFSTNLLNLNNKKAFFPCEENKFYVPIGLGTSGTINIAHTNPNYGFVRYYPNSSWNAYLIDFTNKSITVNSSAYSLTQMHQETLIDDVLSTGITTQEYYSSEYQEALLYEYCIYYNGPIKNSTRSIFLNEQENNKRDFWDYKEDDVYSYWSGDIRLYDDYFEVKDFETNVSEYSMYLIRYSPTESIFGDYIIPNSYSYYEISKPNQGGTSTWQISNISDFSSGDAIYSIGIGTSDTPDLLRSEWFDSDENLSDFMNSNSFRLRYYIEDIPNFFIPKNDGTTGDGNLGQITNPSGDVTGNINLGDIVGPGTSIAGDLTLEQITENIEFDIIANPYQKLWDDILGLLVEAMLSEGNRTITFETRSGVHTINSDDIKSPEEIKVFLSLFSNTAVLMAMFIEVQKLIIKLSEANASYVLHLGDADMYFYEDCQLM